MCSSQPEYKEAATYLTKYRVSLNTALSLVRGWVLQALEQCVQQAKHTSDGANSSTGDKKQNLIFLSFISIYNNNFGFHFSAETFTLLYGKFRLHSEKMKQLMVDIETRREKGPELVYSTYFYSNNIFFFFLILIGCEFVGMSSC